MVWFTSLALKMDSLIRVQPLFVVIVILQLMVLSERLHSVLEPVKWKWF